jgi:predicted nuclease of predicted toxin-antitoxin system
MICFYANENFPFPVVQELRKLGYNIITVQETGLAGQALSDIEVLSYAIKKNCVLLTLNRKHFISLHLKNQDHKRIIVCTFDPDFSALANHIHETIHYKKD